MGDVNYYGDRRKAVISGDSIYEEYVGEKVYNFACAFCVPVKDERLETMVRQWNETGDAALVDAIMNRVEAVGGVNFIWR